MIRKTTMTSFLLLVLGAFGAQAAIVQTYSDKVSFLANVPIVSGNIITIGSGPAPNIDLTGSAASESAGYLTLAAALGNLFGDSVDVSTETATEDLDLNFSLPMRAVGLTLFVSDDSFTAINGSLLVSAVGSGTTTVPVTTSGGVFIGLESDTNFSQIVISLDSFDTGATSTPFVTLTNAVLPELAVPAPGLGVFGLPAFVLWQRRRNAAHSAD